MRDITQIVMRPIDSIRPYGNNPRKNDNAVRVVAKSLEKFGFKQPIVIDTNDEIVAGETRWKAAKLLGKTEVPCVLADDLTPEEVRAYRLADNKVAEYAEWDEDKLEQEIAALAGEMDMAELFGFCSENSKFALPGMEGHIDNFFESGVQTKPKGDNPEPPPVEDGDMFPHYKLFIPDLDHEAMKLITDICNGRGVVFELEEI